MFEREKSITAPTAFSPFSEGNNEKARDEEKEEEENGHTNPMSEIRNPSFLLLVHLP